MIKDHIAPAGMLFDAERETLLPLLRPGEAGVADAFRRHEADA
jgi:hypothetical protein